MTPKKAKSDIENYFSPPGEAALSLVPPSAPPPADTSSGLDPNTIPRPSLTRKAKVLYDYDAADKNELSLLADEVSVRAYSFTYPCVRNSCFFPVSSLGSKSNLGADNMFPVLEKFRMSFFILFGLP